MFFLLILLNSFLYALSPRVDSIVSTMSPEELAGQMVIVYNSPISFLEGYHIGGILIMQNMLKSEQKLKINIATKQKKLPLPLLVCIDQEGGKVNRLSKIPGFESVPSASELGKLSHDSIVAIVSKSASKMKELGINVNLAPVLDPSLDFRGEDTFMKTEHRSFGDDSSAIVASAIAFVDGYSKYGIGCVSKHFPGYDVKTNSDHQIAVSEADSFWVVRQTRIFSQLSSRTIGTMMTSIEYSSFCSEPAVFCKKIVDIQKQCSKSSNLVITDDLWGVALRSFVSGKDVSGIKEYPRDDFAKLVRFAILAGNDMLMITYPQKVEIITDEIVRLFNSDDVLKKQIIDSVKRIISAKISLSIM